MSDKSLTGVEKVYVYQIPVRLWHWINMFAIIVLSVTGYFIGNPLPTLSGEASDHYLMGWIRFWHFAAAYIFTIGLLGRIYWAFAGNRFSKEMFYIPVWKLSWWLGFIEEVKWYLFLKKEPGKHEGHSPTGQFAMFVMFFLVSVMMILTGFAMYAEGLGRGSWADVYILSWVLPLFGDANTATLHAWHAMGMWIIIVFVIIHVYLAVREDIMSRQTMVSAMISGWRYFKDKR